MTRTLRLGFSPCPNDTFMFHDLVHGLVATPGIEFAPELLDIEALNQAALATPPRFDITKLSLPALAARVDEYSILDTGAALGRGCGPLVVTAADRRGTAGLAGLTGLADATVAIPGSHTTAFLLLRIFAPAVQNTVTMRFDEIMPAVTAGRVDAGLIIHESRFTYRDHGLREVVDLGTLWEDETGLPLPLGIIAARRTLEPDVVAMVESALGQSVAAAFAAPDRSRAWIGQHAREIDDAVCRAHIELYVNAYSRHLGDEGRRAVEELLERGRAVGHLPSTLR